MRLETDLAGDILGNIVDIRNHSYVVTQDGLFIAHELRTGSNAFTVIKFNGLWYKVVSKPDCDCLDMTLASKLALELEKSKPTQSSSVSAATASSAPSSSNSAPLLNSKGENYSETGEKRDTEALVADYLQLVDKLKVLMNVEITKKKDLEARSEAQNKAREDLPKPKSNTKKSNPTSSQASSSAPPRSHPKQNKKRR